MTVDTTDIKSGSGRTKTARYWSDYLSDNGRSLYTAAAEVERTKGPGFTLSDVADHMGTAYESAQSIHRTTGRAAKRWKRDTAEEAPIGLVNMEYGWHQDRNGMRWTYCLPDGVADEVATF